MTRSSDCVIVGSARVLDDIKGIDGARLIGAAAGAAVWSFWVQASRVRNIRGAPIRRQHHSIRLHAKTHALCQHNALQGNSSPEQSSPLLN
jgi:hypothetical protein